MNFLFAKPRNKLLIGSWIIRKTEGLDFSHCAILENNTIYECVFSGVREINYCDWLNKYELVEAYEGSNLTKDQMLLFMDAHKDAAGDPYSFTQLFFIWIGIVFTWLSVSIGRTEVNGRKAWICSEYVGLVQSILFGYKFEKKFDMLRLKDVRSAAIKIAKDHDWKVYKF